MKLSVIVYPSPDGRIDMADTMGSIKSQTYADCQVLCASPQTGEPVSGVLNRTIKEATGEYVLLLRAGDTLFTADTLQVAAQFLTGEDVYIGQTRQYAPNGKGYTFNPPFEMLSISYMCRYLPLPCSMFVRTDLLREHPMDSHFSFLHVWEFVMRQWLYHTRIVRPLYLTIAVTQYPSKECLGQIKEEYRTACDLLIPKWIQLMNEKPDMMKLNRYQRGVLSASLRKPMSRDWKMIRLSFFQLLREAFGKA